MYKQLIQLNTRKTNHPIKKRTDISLKKTWKDAQHHSSLEKCKSKPQWDITSCWSECPSSESLQTINARGGGEKGTLLHYWWECKLVWPLWRTLWRFLKTLEIELPYNPLYFLPEETRNERHTRTSVFTATLLTVARTWKQPRCLSESEDKWIRKLWYIYTTECYSAIKRNALESVLMRWMKLEPITQSEEREIQILCINTYIWNF